MSVKGMIRRAIATSILLVTMFWTIAIATCGEGAQPQAIMPEASEAKQRRVMDVDEMCKLLNITSWWRAESHDYSPGTTRISSIHISMDEICEKEESFENKAVPVTETMKGKVFKVVYFEIEIWYEEGTETNTVLESKHIRAFHKFLQMFAGREVEWISIGNKKMTQDREELQKIRDILQANPWTCEPIIVNTLQFYSTDEAKTTHPAIPQLVIQAVKLIGVINEKFTRVDISIPVNHIQKYIQLLGKLRCKKLNLLLIRIEDEEQPSYGEVAVEPSLTQSEQRWKYDIKVLEVLSYYDSCSATLPTWMVRKPTQELLLDISLYMRLSKEGIESIRAEKLVVHIRNEKDQSNIKSDTTRKKSEGVINEMVPKLWLNYEKYSPNEALKKEMILEYLRCSLTWAATQFPFLTEIRICSLTSLFNDYFDFFQDIDRMGVVFKPRMQNLIKLKVFGYTVQLLKNECTMLRKMPFIMRPKLWKAYASGQMEVQINKQLGLKKSQEEYIRLQVSETEKTTKKFSCPICKEDFRDNDETNWIYVTEPCRHAYCVKCLNTCFKNSASVCILGKILLQSNWKECYHIEEADSNTYSVTLSSVKEDKNGKVKIGEFEEVTVVIK